MLEVGGRLDFGQESLGTDGGGKFWFENLERDLPLMLEVVGQIDGCHTALTEFTYHAVAPLEGSVQSGQLVGHEVRSKLGGRESRKHSMGHPSGQEGRVAAMQPQQQVGHCP